MEDMSKDTLDQQSLARFLSASADSNSRREPIAIIGMGCRFPGAKGPEDFWQLLCNEVDAITEVPADRFPINALYDPRPGLVGKVITRWGGFLDSVDQFDALFFGISPHAANRMDPQYRLLLEVAWEALEDAGITREQLVGSKTGVFIGMTTGDYQDLQCRNTEEIDVYVVTGGLRSVASGRISYAFDLQGPSLVVDTACTSSLTALHLACQSLRAGECSMALVGGSHLILQPELTLGFSAAGMLSPDGHCKFGDANANGYVRSEGVGMLVLKPLSQALADGDPIQALIRGSATNNDGRSGKSLVTPGYDTQVAVLREAYRDANILPSQVHYVEAHGTGTSVGDSVEIRALATVLAEGRALDHPCHIGSVKTNIGHTEGAAGMASLVKAVLCLKHRALPKSLHCEHPNPVLPWHEFPLVIQQTLEPLAEQDEPVVIGVSAFGVSGTNAHIVLEGAEKPASDINKNDASDQAFLFPLSAHTPEALTALARSYQAFTPEYALADVCYTAGVRRTHHAHRLALVIRSYEEFHAQLENFLQGRADPNMAFGSVRSDIPQHCFAQLDQIETALPSLRHGEDEYTAQLRSLALLYTFGCPITWSKLYPADSRCVSLPSYPWQHEHFWMETDARDAYNRPPVSEQQRDASSHPLLGHHWTSAVHSATHFWDMILSIDLFPYLNDHRVQGATVLPAAVYAEIALAAAKEVFPIVPVLNDISFKRALILSEGKEEHVQLVLTLERPGVATFQFFSQEASSENGQTTWTLHALGTATTDLSAVPLCASKCETSEQIQARCQQVYTRQEYYQSLARRGFQYGPCFQALAKIERRDGEALGRIQLAEQAIADAGAYLIHPALLDGCLQVLFATLPTNMGETDTYVPVMLKGLRIADRLGQHVWSHAVLREVRDEKTDVIEGDVFLTDAQGRVLMAALGLVGQRLADAREQQHLRDRLYEWRWEARSWTQIDRSLKTLPHGQWLLFADHLGISEQLNQLLTASGSTCVLAFKGASYQQLTPQRYLLQPGSPQDVQQFLKDVSSTSHPLCGIIHLWSVDAHPTTTKTAASIEAAQQAGTLSIMHLVQALARLGRDRPPPLWLVTCGAQPVDQSNHALSVEQAPVSGLGRVLVNEHPELQCRRIDLERTDVSEQAQLLFRELQVGDREDEVALSKEARLVHRLVRCETEVIANKQPLFRSDVTYLITGGLGGLGLTVADWMVRQGARYLVLVGRSGASLEADQVITTLQEMGAQIVTANADISEERQVADLLTTIHTSLPPLRGLIHAAAVLDDGVILQQDTQRFRKVMAPKIKGAWNLHTLTAHMDLDFFVLFSSGATLLGLPGQGNYVAANEFLDVLAHFRRRLGLSGLSINWGPWSEVGMATRSHSAERLASRGMSGIPSQQGLDALAYLLLQDHPQVAVMSVDWSQWLLFSPEVADSPSLTHLLAQSQAMTHAIVQAAQGTLQASLLATRPEEHLELVTCYLSEQIDQALGLVTEKSKRNLPLVGQGLDSLMAIELKNKIQAGLGVSVSVTKLLESASTTQLAQEVFEQLQTALTHQQAVNLRRNKEQPKRVRQDPDFTQTPSLVGRERTEPLPLSFAQQRLWFLDKMFPGSTTYNVSVIVRLTGSLNIEALQQSLQEIVRRHEVLRTTFGVVNEQPVQVISSESAISLPLVDLCAYRFEEREQAAMRLATEEAQLPFDLARGPLLRAQVLHLSTSEYWLLITVHHIVFDAWSFGVMLRELDALYTAHVHGQPSPLADLPLQYADYTLWQHEQMQGKLLDDQLTYWKEYLKGAPLVLELPTDHPRPAVQSYRGARFFFRFSPVLMERVADLSRREGVTLFMTLLATWQIVLGHTSQQEDFLVGVPVAGRQQRGMGVLIGLFVNTLVLRAELAGHLTFRDLLKQVKQTTLAAYEHQDVPFEQLVEVLHPQRDVSRNPVFQVMFVLQNMPFPSLTLPGLSAIASEGPCTTARFDVSINLWEKADFDHWIEYATDLFEEGTIARMVAHYQRVLEQVVVNADLPIARISLLTEHEHQQVIFDWNATRVDYKRPGWIHQWISEQAQRTPNAPALFFEQEVMTYQQLEQRSNQLGHYLQRLGVGPEQCVGVYLERSFTLVLALLAVLKAGGAYIPLDTGYSNARLSYMLKDGQISLLLTQTSLRDRLSSFEGREVVLDETWDVISRESETLVSSQVIGQNLAYVIYTSGSTGHPKGVMNTHEGLANCLNWMQDAFGLTAADRVLQQTPISFDVSVWEIFWPLTSGAGLVLARPGGQQDPRYIQDVIVSAEVTTVHFVPSMLQNYLQMQETYPIPKHRLQRVICIGEALSSATVERNQQQWAVPLFNLYGPTEATIEVTWWACSQQGEGQQTVPIGHPIANTQIYLLDKHGEPVPVGVAGELSIGGVQVVRGYLHRSDLTAERFVPDPWSNEPGERLYKTGDLARYRADGAIEFLGRLDQQIKLRGNRIELGEIEASLARQAEVDEAVVMVREEGEQKLVAYLRGTGQVAASELRKRLRERVPECMVPSAFVWVQHWPLTPNGKIDRRALPAPDQLPSELDKTFVAPRTPVEVKLAEIWTDLLGLKQVGIHESFFDVGGHSLLATQLVTRLHASLHVEVSLRELLQAATIAGMVSILEQRMPMQNGHPITMLQANSVETGSMDQLLRHLESLSDDEVLTQLAKIGSGVYKGV